MDLKKITDACNVTASRIGLKTTDVSSAVERILKANEKLVIEKDESLLIRECISLLYWNSQKIGGRLKPLLVTYAQFIELISNIQFDHDNDDAILCAVQIHENLLAEVFDASSLNLIGEKLTHFSAKLTHSKASGSVLIPGNRISKLPYLFSATLQNTAPLPVDLTKNDGDASAQSLAKLINGDRPEVNQAVSEKIMHWHQSRSVKEINDKNNTVDARVRQIILPKDKQEVVLSPLYAGGISRRINESDKLKRFNAERITMKFGGANPQNISVHGQPLQSVWLFNTPSPDSDIKTAFSIALRGYWVSLDWTLSQAYNAWIQANQNYMGDRDTTKATEIEKTASPFHPMIHAVINRVENAMVSCESAKEEVQEKLNSLNKNLSDLYPLERAVLNGVMTDSAVKDLTNRIIKAMSKSKIKMTDSTNARHRHVIPEIIRKRLQITLGAE